MSTEALRKAVEPKRYTMQHRPDWAYNQCSMMPDKDGEYIRHSDVADALATHRANYDALVIRLGEVTARLEAADGLLRESEAELRGACLSRESDRISQDIRAHLGGDHG